MARWEPGGRQRLRAAAQELFTERGYDQTTVADIAARADLTERTFYRYFTDKREVLFDGSDELSEAMVGSVEQVPVGASEGDLIRAALDGLSAFFPADRRTFSRRRQRILDAEPALQEREMLKLARLAATLAATLEARDVPAFRASLMAETAMAIFRTSFAQWIAAEPARDLADIQREALRDWRALAGS